MIYDLIANTLNSSYPPFNIKKTKNGYQIELAVAGLPKDSIEVEFKPGTLTILAKKTDTEGEYVHKGISTRAFRKSFSLASNITVLGAEHKDGVLVINLESNKETSTQKVDIK